MGADHLGVCEQGGKRFLRVQIARVRQFSIIDYRTLGGGGGTFALCKSSDDTYFMINSEGLPTKSRALSSKITKRTTKNHPCSQYHNTDYV